MVDVLDLWNYTKFLKRSKSSYSRPRRYPATCGSSRPPSEASLLLDPKDNPQWYPTLAELRADPLWKSLKTIPNESYT